MAVHVSGQNMSSHREMVDRTPYKPRCILCCRQIKDTPVPELHDTYAGRLSRIGSGDRELVDIKVLCSVSDVSRQPEMAGWKAD